MRSDSPGGKHLGPRTDQAPVSFMPLLNAVGEIFFKIFIISLILFNQPLLWWCLNLTINPILNHNFGGPGN
jgi:hypothetical protein